MEDPEVHVGSGGATLNALLVAAEHLSARAGFTVSGPDVPSLAQWGGGFKQSFPSQTTDLREKNQCLLLYAIEFCVICYAELL